MCSQPQFLQSPKQLKDINRTNMGPNTRIEAIRDTQSDILDSLKRLTKYTTELTSKKLYTMSCDVFDKKKAALPQYKRLCDRTIELQWTDKFSHLERASTTTITDFLKTFSTYCGRKATVFWRSKNQWNPSEIFTNSANNTTLNRSNHLTTNTAFQTGQKQTTNTSEAPQSQRMYGTISITITGITTKSYTAPCLTIRILFIELQFQRIDYSDNSDRDKYRETSME
jgi:hypothetical protein